jgi:ornithine decarboxylase antizyme 1
VLRRRGSVYIWAQGLGSAPDVPHAEHLSARLRTEGSGVGIIKEPPVSVKGQDSGSGNGTVVRGVGGTASDNGVSHLCFVVSLGSGQDVKWDTLLIGKTLFIEIPGDILPEGSRESFVSVLEHAEDVLACSKVIICFKKNREDRASLIRTFKFFGFALVAPGSHQLAAPVSGDMLYLAYTIDPDSSSQSESESDCD